MKDFLKRCVAMFGIVGDVPGRARGGDLVRVQLLARNTEVLAFDVAAVGNDHERPVAFETCQDSGFVGAIGRAGHIGEVPPGGANNVFDLGLGQRRLEQVAHGDSAIDHKLVVPIEPVARILARDGLGDRIS